MRVHELAKALQIPSKELLERLKPLRIKATAANSTLDADAVNRIRKALAQRPAAKKPPSKTTGVTRPTVAVPPRKGVPAATVSLPPRAPTTVVAVPSPKAAAPAAAPRPQPEAAPAPRQAPRPSPAAPVTPVAVEPKRKPRQRSPAAPTTSVGAPKPHEAAPVEVAAQASTRPDTGAATAVMERELAPAKAPALAPAEAPLVEKSRRLELKFPITVKDLAAKMEVKAHELIKALMQQGVFASILQLLEEAAARRAAGAFGYELAPQPTLEEQLHALGMPNPERLIPRAPVVTLMGHVDHGKTSLLDAIRETKVASQEAGGITQHIGAYEVWLEKGRVTFLDTPGHEAFTALRARGANVTDVVVLVVAADDGMMPQTVEAIDHAKAAGVPIVVAINKVDKPEANVQKVKQQLSQHGLISEEWGGKTIMMPVSAKTRQGVSELLELLLLEAELLELKADPTVPAQGAVIEAKQTRDRGPVATVLVQQGTLRVGETILVGQMVGRVRAMSDDRGRRIPEAPPAKPVEVLGLPEVPEAGDRFLVVEDERLAKQLAEQRAVGRQRVTTHPPRMSLEDLHRRITEGQLKELRLILKADVQGSLEAIVQSLEKLDVAKEGIHLLTLHAGVGDIGESDVMLAAASDAIVVGFHVGIEPKVQVLAAVEGVDLHIYQIIYELVGAMKAAVEGLLEPEVEETFVGRAEVRRVFELSKGALVAGCMVIKGSLRRDCAIRVIRGRERIAQVPMAGLRRVKDDVREVPEGVECGVRLEGSVTPQVGDLLEAWDVKKVARKLA